MVEGCDAALQLDADKADILSLVQARLKPAPSPRTAQDPPTAASQPVVDMQSPVLYQGRVRSASVPKSCLQAWAAAHCRDYRAPRLI